MTTSIKPQPRAAPANDVRETMRYAIGESTLGSVLIASSAKGITSILIGDDSRVLIENLKANFPNADLRAAGVEDDRLVDRVVGMVEDLSIGADL